MMRIANAAARSLIQKDLSLSVRFGNAKISWNVMDVLVGGSTSNSLVAANRLHLNNPTGRSLAVAAKKNKSSKSSESSNASYMALKRAAKEKRRALFAASQERKEKVRTRREGKVRDEKRREFREWFIPRKVNEEYMNRKARQAGLGWRYQVSVILTRGHVVLPDKEDWEEEYENLHAYLLQFGKVYPKELKLDDVEDDDGEFVPTSDEDLMKLLPEGFVPAPRETEADASGDIRTTQRKLKTDIYLAVKEQSDGLWQLPTVDLKDGETLLDAAKRAVPEKVGGNVEFWSVSNAPLSVQLDAFPEDQRSDGYYGTKTFFMKLYYDEGLVSESEMTVSDFAWLDRGEISSRIGDQHGDEAAKFYHYLL